MTGTAALIHLDNLKHNLETVRRLVGRERRICMPVKANAYGHGMVPVARAALEYGCDCLAIARTEEGLILRREGLTCPILIMGHAPEEELADLVAGKLEPYGGSPAYLEALERAADRVLPPGEMVSVHLKVDTGMGRIGYIFASPRLRLAGVCTHFPASDTDDPGDRAFTEGQLAALTEAARMIRTLPGAGENGPFLVHGANSGAVAQHGESCLDMVRPGIMLYGYEPLPQSPVGVRPLMELSARLVFAKRVPPGQTVSYGRTWRAERETWIGTVSVGYADGYNRLLSNRGKVMINGRIYPVAGRVCMDQIMVDLGPELREKVGDRVILFGPPPCPFSAADIAEELNTISYEVCCLITARVKRIYLSEGKPCIIGKEGISHGE